VAAANLYTFRHSVNLQSVAMRTLVTASAILIATGLFGTGWAVGQLRDGATELPQHWWSSAPVALIALGATLALIAWATPRLARNSA
jgi:hypothetical protein